MAIREPALAKINLFLEVLGKRADGYHHLRSLMVFCDVGEYVEVSLSNCADAPVTLRLHGPMAKSLRAQADNLVTRAAQAFMGAAHLQTSIVIDLYKVMPVSSGIGGGSADAAATLRALNVLFERPLSEQQLLKLSADLGADVPACFLNRPVLLDGVGPELTQVAMFADWPFVVLVNPGYAVSTPAVFGALGAAPMGTVPSNLPTSWTTKACLTRNNHLEPPAIASCPAIQSCLNILKDQEGAQFVRMSGSGATCFGLFGTKHHAEQASNSIQRENRNWWVCASMI